MVAKVQSSDFSIFIKKIGYSVGLESTFQRLQDFARLYASKDRISIGDLKRLLHAPKPNGWGLDEKNEHVLDFLRAIEVVQVRGGEVGVLEFGESLGILAKLQSSADFDRSLRVLLAYALIIADGDIFLNALSSNFEELEFSNSLARAIEYKWSILETTFKSAQQRSAIYKTVIVETQENNPGSRGRNTSKAGPLQMGTFEKSGPLGGESNRPEIKFSPNYIAKTLGRRKAWAQSLGLYNEFGDVTSVGERLLSNLRKLGFGGPACLCVWPLEYELRTPLFSSLKLPAEITPLNSWELLNAVASSLESLEFDLKEIDDCDFEIMQKIIGCFQSLNTSRRMLRNEIPVRVVYRCVVGLSISSGRISNYPQFIRAEQGFFTPRFIARESRLAEMAISLVR
ncbi:hypothetical protein [Pseudomonas sp. NBRC 111130]|uniref:hypothetical protein n=1 Tax=Pseudomonas sp. NBRC 111130 TaxID=1661045 RepID=UPI000AC7B694|nr:hypothetical protein [Pseudomonas sp. NBRC 111130]